MKFFNHPEGYIEPDGAGGYDYVYQYKDHLGNIRISYSDDNDDGTIDTSEIIEENNYYPFGMLQKGYNAQVNGTHHNWDFQGQERAEDLDLNVLEFKYRIHDPTTGRFWQIDPLAEDYTYNSTYAFAENKVMMGNELEGLELGPTHFEIYKSAKIQGRSMSEVAQEITGANVFKTEEGRAVMGALAETGVGFIPFVGQAIDIKDTYNAFNGGDVWDKVFAAVAWIPGGDIFKGLRRIFKNVDELGNFRHVGDNLSLGQKRENLVAELTGGGVAHVDGKDLKIGAEINGEKVNVTVDVIGKNGELITVGGTSKANKLSAFGDHLNRLKKVAGETGVKAQAYLSQNTPQKVVDLAKKHLGEDNVFLFKDPK